MPSFRLITFLLVVFVSTAFAKTITVTSPDKKITFQLSTVKNSLVYRVSYKSKLLVSDSRLSLSFKEGGEFGHDISIGQPLSRKMEEDYDLVVGRSSHIHSLSNAMIVPVTEKGGMKRQLNIEVRVFNDGAAFRYVIPGKDGWQNVEITDESDAFNLTGDPTALTLFRGDTSPRTRVCTTVCPSARSKTIH